MTEKDWINSLRRERLRMQRTAYHEVGHSLAMYLCYGNIDRISSISVEWDGSGICSHEAPMDFHDYMDYLQKGGIFGNLFNEVCYLVGGGLSEAMFCNKAAEAILSGKKYKFPIKGMEGDLKHIKEILGWNGICYKKDIDAFIRLAVIRLKHYFYDQSDKIKHCVNTIIQEEGFINKIVFYRIFDEKLYRKEIAKIRHKR